MPRQSKKQKRSAWVPVTAVLLALALAGTVLFSAFREKIDRWEYPQRYEAYVQYYAGSKLLSVRMKAYRIIGSMPYFPA